LLGVAPSSKYYQRLANSGKRRRLFGDLLEFYAVGMVRRLHNWEYRDVIEFLKENGFVFLKELRGSHERWVTRGENGAIDKIVEVNFTHASYPPLTLKTMIRQSGIDQKHWVKWAGS
jgi:predicted RNA binding protein YcfA (HicA-like mRNA interferase family)